MKSILIVTTIPDTISAFLLPFIEHFRDRGWRVDGMAQGINNFPECIAACDKIWDIEWSRNPLEPKNFFSAAPKIKQLIRQEKYTLVHVHTPVAAFVTRWAINSLPKQERPQVIYTAHGFHFYRGGNYLKNAIFLNLEKLAGKWTDFLVTINREDEEAAKTYGLVEKERIVYMPGIGVDLQLYDRQGIPSQELERVRQEIGISPDTPLFICIAEFIPRKRHRDILEAFAQLKITNVALAFAGEGTTMKAMENLAVELGIGDRVYFLGYRRDIPALIQSASAILLVSAQEGLPRSILEALAMGVPVIGSNIRGIKDLLREERGILVPVGDTQAIAKAMAWIVEHPEEALLMGQRGRNTAHQYDLQTIIAQHEILYDLACAENDRNIY
jgi:glycosyltransferase involved in cell wall biosynthesis